MCELIKSRTAMLKRVEPILRRLRGIPKPFVVEVGVSGALMSEHMLTSRPDLLWHGVDNWAPEADQPKAYRATGDVHARRTKAQQDGLAAFAVARVARFGRRATVHRRASPAAVEDFGLLCADLVFLDGDHSYEAVYADIRAWWSVVHSGGWLGGHDIHNRINPAYTFEGVDRAVEEWVTAERLDLELDTGCTWFVRKP
jgi:Methyltransferase domain